ncbi:WD_REPEATS_REGION domain-containing protein [Linnemannia elongata]|nr:WD_REPEATS_REGION domain-containing protein [Linnemannia elongata]
MIDHPKNTPPPSGGDKAPRGTSVFSSLKTAAKKAFRPSSEGDYSVANAVAAFHVDQTSILNGLGRFSISEPSIEDPDNNDATIVPPVETIIAGLTVLEAPTSSRVSLQNIAKPIFRTSLPKSGARFKSTLQLAFAHHLLPKESSSSPPMLDPLVITGDNAQEVVFDEVEEAWIKSIKKDSFEQGRVRWLTAQVVAKFLIPQHKDATTIAEVVLLGPVLERDDYRSVFSSLIDQLERENLLAVKLLQGLVQLLQNASPGYLIDDDLVRILRVLRQRLKDTYKELGDVEHAASDHIHYLVIVVSRVLDAMMEGNVKGLHRTEDHQPLLDILAELWKDSSDPYLKFQASYAWQALQYVDDDESPLHAVLRFSSEVAIGALGVAGILKFDPENLFNGLQQLVHAAEQVIDVAKTMVEGAQSLRSGGEGLVDSMLKGFRSGAKRAWYPALQGARVFIREGRLADFQRVIYEAPCRKEANFQQGVCQLLGELAIDLIWTTETREKAVDLLGELYRNCGSWSLDAATKNTIPAIIHYVSEHAEDVIKAHATKLWKSLAVGGLNNLPRSCPLMSRLRLPETSPLLAKTFKILPEEYAIYRLKVRRQDEYKQHTYISPQARPIIRKPEEDDEDNKKFSAKRFPLLHKAKGRPIIQKPDEDDEEISAERFSLLDKVEEFLVTGQQVFLIMGDSGAGKSTFNRYLEQKLWKAYKQGDPIPLFINLPAIEKPQKELISEHLRTNNFSGDDIQYLKETRRFIVICDSYDESQLAINLHSTNAFNRPEQWNTKMIISCRSAYLDKTYRKRFQPQPIDQYSPPTPHLFQEVAIVPFSSNQIKVYVEQFVQEKEVHELFGNRPVWNTEEYMEKLEEIPHLLSLVANPFLLVMALRTLPGIIYGVQHLAGVVVNRSSLYRAFVKQWLESGERRLEALALKLSKEENACLQELSDAGFVNVATDFLKDLAAAIFKEQNGNPIVRYLHRDDKDTWKAKYFGPGTEAKLLRDASPLTRSGVIHRFIHRSLLEYFFTFEEHEIHQLRTMRLQEYDSQRQRACYPLYAKSTLHGLKEDSHPLMETVAEFLQSERQVLLLLGGVASGKSAFCRQLEYDLLRLYNPGDPIPLLISLPLYSDSKQDLISSHLQRSNFSDDVIQELKQHRQFIIICDGYDEVRLSTNIHTSNGFNQPGCWNVRSMVVTCRSSFLGQGYQMQFAPESTTPNTPQLFQEATIVPFTRNQIQECIQQYVHSMSSDMDLSVQAIWGVERYFSALDAMAGLMALSSNPSILSLILELLSSQFVPPFGPSDAARALSKFYDTIVSRWTSYSMRRLQGTHLSRDEILNLDLLLDDGFDWYVTDYQKRLALAIFEQQDGHPVVAYDHLREGGTWKAKFFGSDVVAALLRESSLLIRIGDQYQFIEQSMLQYFYSLVIGEPYDNVYFDDSDDEAEVALPEFAADHPLNKRSIVGESMVLQFLVSRVGQTPALKVPFFAVVETSKTDAGVAVAAANAITILVKAGEQFDDLDLSNIRIPGADLTGSSLQPDRLQGADLTGAILPRSFSQ